MHKPGRTPRLTWAQVLAVRRLYSQYGRHRTQKAIAKQFGVAPSVIFKAVNKRPPYHKKPAAAPREET